jgi:hypothetical protein
MGQFGGAEEGAKPLVCCGEDFSACHRRRNVRGGPHAISMATKAHLNLPKVSRRAGNLQLMESPVVS